MAEQYQKIKHSGHCSEDSNCITHCTTFGLSDSKCAEHYSNCSHAHVLDCSDCINIILTFDKISRNIEKITDKDVQREVKFDYENALEHIAEWSRHNLHATRQDAEKSIISQMGQDEAFCTFDWDQKSCHKSSKKFKVRTLEKEVCQCWSDHSFRKIHYYHLRPL